MAKTSIDGQALKAALGAGLARVAEDVDLINKLNVFPVPDGDTGINMYHTLERAWREVADNSSDDASEIAQRFAHGALMGARGNSGTILSQLLKGFADGLDSAPSLTPALLICSCRAAVERAYAAVSQPVEGTILTVAREATEALGADNLAAEALDDVMAALAAAAEQSLADTPQKLPILKEAGVVDAGGMGLLSFLRGLQGTVSLAEPALARPRVAAAAGIVSSMDGEYGYDVQFIMRGAGMNLSRIRRDFEALGNSVIVVGDDSTIKAHLHVDNPARPIDYAIAAGAALDDVVVENMQLQYQELAAQMQMPSPANAAETASDLAVIAVAEGPGIQSVYRELGCARVICGGPGQSPAAEEFISAVEELAANQIIILPNDPNIVLAAQQAAHLMPDRAVTVLPTETAIHGISAMIAYGDAADSGAGPDAMIDRMAEAAAECRVLCITQATRASEIGGRCISEGDYIAFIDGRLALAAADLESALQCAIAKLVTDETELASLYFGAELSPIAAGRLIECLSRRFDQLEFELIDGGQPIYPVLLSVE